MPPQWPKREDLQGYQSDPDSVTRELTVQFRFNEQYGPYPFAIQTDPPLQDLDDVILLLLMSTGIRVLTQRHGLRPALDKVEDVAYGRIDGKKVFKIGGAEHDGLDPYPEK